jgi:15-cis-phytoene synthase/lycopene beta-cyclase
MTKHASSPDSFFSSSSSPPSNENTDPPPLTYFGVHIYYTLPPILLLLVLLKPIITRTELNKLYTLSVIAFIYTTPWDNYIVSQSAWGYEDNRVLGVVGYVPVEEYAFFIIQTVFTGLVCLGVYGWEQSMPYLKIKNRSGSKLNASRMVLFSSYSVCFVC